MFPTWALRNKRFQIRGGGGGGGVNSGKEVSTVSPVQSWETIVGGKR